MNQLWSLIRKVLHQHYEDGSLRYLGNEYKVVVTETFPTGGCKLVGLDLSAALSVLGMNSIKITKKELENTQSIKTPIVAHFVHDYEKATSDELYDVYLKPIAGAPPPTLPELSNGQAIFTVSNSLEGIVEWTAAITWALENLTSERMGKFTFKLLNTSLGSDLSKHLFFDKQNGRNLKLVILYHQNEDQQGQFLRLEVEYIDFDPQNKIFSVKHKGAKDQVESSESLKPMKSDQKFVLHEMYSNGELRYMGSNLNTSVAGEFPDNTYIVISGLDDFSSLEVYTMKMIRISSESEPFPAFVEPKSCVETSTGIWEVLLESPKQRFTPRISPLSDSQRRLIITNSESELLWFIPKVEWKEGVSHDTSVSLALVDKGVERELMASLADKDGIPVKGITLITYVKPGERADKAIFSADLKAGQDFRIKIIETIETYNGINLYEGDIPPTEEIPPQVISKPNPPKRLQQPTQNSQRIETILVPPGNSSNKNAPQIPVKENDKEKEVPKRKPTEVQSPLPSELILPTHAENKPRDTNSSAEADLETRETRPVAEEPRPLTVVRPPVGRPTSQFVIGSPKILVPIKSSKSQILPPPENKSLTERFSGLSNPANPTSTNTTQQPSPEQGLVTTEQKRNSLTGNRFGLFKKSVARSDIDANVTVKKCGCILVQSDQFGCDVTTTTILAEVDMLNKVIFFKELTVPDGKYYNIKPKSFYNSKDNEAIGHFLFNGKDNPTSVASLGFTKDPWRHDPVDEGFDKRCSVIQIFTFKVYEYSFLVIKKNISEVVSEFDDGVQKYVLFSDENATTKAAQCPKILKELDGRELRHIENKVSSKIEVFEAARDDKMTLEFIKILEWKFYLYHVGTSGECEERLKEVKRIPGSTTWRAFQYKGKEKFDPSELNLAVGTAGSDYSYMEYLERTAIKDFQTVTSKPEWLKTIGDFRKEDAEKRKIIHVYSDDKQPLLTLIVIRADEKTKAYKIENSGVQIEWNTLHAKHSKDYLCMLTWRVFLLPYDRTSLHDRHYDYDSKNGQFLPK